MTTLKITKCREACLIFETTQSMAHWTVKYRTIAGERSKYSRSAYEVLNMKEISYHLLFSNFLMQCWNMFASVIFLCEGPHILVSNNETGSVKQGKSLYHFPLRVYAHCNVDEFFIQKGNASLNTPCWSRFVGPQAVIKMKRFNLKKIKTIRTAKNTACSEICSIKTTLACSIVYWFLVPFLIKKQKIIPFDMSLGETPPC